MFGPRARALARPAFASTTQCLKQTRIQHIPRITLQHSARQRRYQSSGSFLQNTKTLWRAHPFSVTAAFGFIVFGIGSLVWVNGVYQNYIIGEFKAFPEEVAKPLRRALYYTNHDLNPRDALKYYKQALRIASEVGMDEFSNEILGVKIQVAALMEKIQQYHKAIDVLEIVRSDCLKWIETNGSLEGNEGQRARVLGKTVAISIHLGELYANEFVMEKEAAEEKLIWAVETVLKEQQRRAVEGVKQGEDEWLTLDEIGATMESLAHNYEEKNQHYLAAPLFLQALNVSPPNSCHTAVLMNNISISLAQQDPPAVPGQPATSRPALVSNAREWAKKALDVAARVAPPARTEECDISCATATHNLGEFAEMDGDIVEARRRYEEAKSLASAIGFKEGVVNSEAGLKRLETKKS